MSIPNKIVSDNHKWSWAEKKMVDGFVYALARLGLAEYAWVDQTWVLRREVKTSVNYVMRARAQKLFNDALKLEEEDV
jgi:hypothetical protein